MRQIGLLDAQRRAQARLGRDRAPCGGYRTRVVRSAGRSFLRLNLGPGGSRDELKRSDLANSALRSIPLNHLHLEALLIWAGAGLADHALLILEEFEGLAVDCVAALDLDRWGTKFDEEEALVVIPGCDPEINDETVHY
jgi:hypothetical protein